MDENLQVYVFEHTIYYFALMIIIYNTFILVSGANTYGDRKRIDFGGSTITQMRDFTTEASLLRSKKRFIGIWRKNRVNRLSDTQFPQRLSN